MRNNQVAIYKNLEGKGNASNIGNYYIWILATYAKLLKYRELASIDI